MAVKKHLTLFILGATLFLASHPSQARTETLSLQDYVSQVFQWNDAYKASQDAATGAKGRSKEASILLHPFLYSTATYKDDKIPTMAPTFMGTRTITKNYSLGLKQATTFGLTADLSYNLNFQNIQNAPLVPQPQVYTGYPYLKLTQSLWRNGFGSETRANQRVQEAVALVSSYTSSFQSLQIKLEAETNYWLLALARESVQTQKEVYSRAEKILEWAQRRSNLNLADKSDMLQAKAALEMRKLELQMAQDEEINSAHRFNMSRNLDHDRVDAELQRVDPEKLRFSKAPSRQRMRDDVKAAEQSEKVAAANVEMALNRNSPTLDIFANLALNSGREAQMSRALSTSFDTQYPTTMVGVSFSTSLDFWGVADARAGYRKEKAAAERNFQRKMFEQERDWQDLGRKLAETQRKLELSLSLEKAQKEKLLYEKERFKRGRTTTYQVLLFEQDYAQAQIGRIRAEGDVLRILSQMKLYGGSES